MQRNTATRLPAAYVRRRATRCFRETTARLTELVQQQPSMRKLLDGARSGRTGTSTDGRTNGQTATTTCVRLIGRPRTSTPTGLGCVPSTECRQLCCPGPNRCRSKVRRRRRLRRTRPVHRPAADERARSAAMAERQATARRRATASERVRFDDPHLLVTRASHPAAD